MSTHKFSIISMATIAVLIQSNNVSADEKNVCKLDGPKLVCAESHKDGKAILAAMANPKTLTLLKSSQYSSSVYADGDAREVFRKSLERNRKRFTRFADREWRKYRRKKVSAEFYEDIRSQYRLAMTAYYKGMEIYREGTWFSTVPPRN